MYQVSSIKNIFLVLLLLLLCCSAGWAQQAEKYSRAKILLSHDKTVMDLSKLGLAVDHGDHRKGKYFISDFSATEIKLAKDAGFTVEILIDDVTKHYQEQNRQPETKSQKKSSSVPCDTAQRPVIGVPSRFHLGSYGGYFTYNEMIDILDSMTLLYPGLISARSAIDTYKTHEGRPIYWLRISNNPSVNQPTKPQILYTALHHSREPGSLSSTIYYMWYLLENYATNPQVKAIVDNSELYFVPCINPDGYIYNIVNSPTGGGMWRKNRRNNNNATYGVDLNRNYGHLWAYDNLGSSANTSTDIYRGPAAFSEPETKAVKWFTEQHNFKLALNYHTYNDELLNPFGHVPIAYPADSLEYSAFGLHLTGYNFYRYGTCYQCLGYVANGGSDDWMYAEQTSKNKIFAFTPEIGEVQYGFYPPSFKIIPDCKNNLTANINAAALVLTYAKIGTADANILTEASGQLHYSLQRLGFGTGAVTVTAQSLDNLLTINGTAKTHTGMAMLEIATDSFSYTLDPSTPNNKALRYVLKVNNGLYELTDTVEFFYGKFNSVVVPDMMSMNSWNNNGWSVNTNIYRTAPSSFKSSPTGGPYPNSSTLVVRLKNAIDLTKSVRAYLQFYSKWDIEPKYDYVGVRVAQEGSVDWTELCGKYTKPGNYDQPLDVPIYDDHQYDWLLEQMDLAPYLGKKINIEFQLVSDAGASYDGFYFDDMKVVTVLDSTLAITNLQKGELKVYPNPAQDKITIDLGGVHTTAHAVLYDCVGRKVKDIAITSARTELNITGLPANIYYLKIDADGEALPVQKIEVR